MDQRPALQSSKASDTATKDLDSLHSHLGQSGKQLISQGEKDPDVELKTVPAQLVPAACSCQSDFPSFMFP